MHLANVVAAGLAPGMALARREVECDYETTANAGETCYSFACSWGLSVDTLQQLNPGMNCPELDTSKSYCVTGTVIEDPDQPITAPTTTTHTTTTKTTTATTTAPSIAENCDVFHKISSGDQCGTVAARYSITVDKRKSWNSETNEDCTNLWLDYYICVHIFGAATTTSQVPEPTGVPALRLRCLGLWITARATT